jgi:hypothetical protein
LVFSILLIGLVSGCGGPKPAVKLGECPLTVTVKSDAEGFDGFANVYINGKFIGTTDSASKQLKISLEKGEHTIVVSADGYESWEKQVLLLGKGYRQSVLARLVPKAN